MKVMQNQKGAVLVAFALILPVFLLLIFGGISLNLAASDKGRLEYATRAGAQAGAAVLLTKDASGVIEEHPYEAMAQAQALFNANAPAGASGATIDITTNHIINVAASKPVDFFGFLPAITLSSTASAKALPN